MSKQMSIEVGRLVVEQVGGLEVEQVGRWAVMWVIEFDP
jgi:hypothetical protein